MTSECAIPFCDFKDISEGNDAKLIPICKSHLLHVGCLKKLLQKEKLPKCPVCRDDYVSFLKDLIVDNPPEKRMEPWEELTETPDHQMYTRTREQSMIPIYNYDLQCTELPTLKRHVNQPPADKKDPSDHS